MLPQLPAPTPLPQPYLDPFYRVRGSSPAQSSQPTSGKHTSDTQITHSSQEGALSSINTLVGSATMRKQVYVAPSFQGGRAEGAQVITSRRTTAEPYSPLLPSPGNFLTLSPQLGTLGTQTYTGFLRQRHAEDIQSATSSSPTTPPVPVVRRSRALNRGGVNGQQKSVRFDTMTSTFGDGWGPGRDVVEEGSKSSSSKSSWRTSLRSHRFKSAKRTWSTTADAGRSIPPLANPVGPSLVHKQADVAPLHEEIDTSEVLEALRQEMAKHELDYYEDAHGSKYVAASDKRREFISGFSGSAGEAIISRRNAYLVVDSRYWHQAEWELNTTFWTIVKAGASNGPKTWIEWLTSRIKGSRIGIDARMLSHEDSVAVISKISAADSKIVYPPQNLVDLVWKNKPLRSEALVFKKGIEYAGTDTWQKIEKIRRWIIEQNHSWQSHEVGSPTSTQKQHVGTLISSLPCIAWVLNLCGQDIPYNLLFHAYLYIGLENAIVFLDGCKVDNLVAQYFQEVGVERRDFVEVWNFLQNREWGEGKVLLPPQTSCAISLVIGHPRCTIVPPFAEYLMAVRNEVELEGLKRAYIRDGTAFVQFLAWLEQRLQIFDITTEWEAANQLTTFRTKQRNFIGLAYENMSANGPNAALPCYSSLRSESRVIDRDTPYLNDSGGRYHDGTCGTARTVHFGRPTAEQREAYTRVLQGLIAIDTAVFPEGTSVHQLDVLARKALWDEGMNDLYGTGCELDSFLTVGEGPCIQSNNIGLVAGHVVTSEPCYYKQDAWGIKIKSTLLVTPVKRKHTRSGDSWLGFERLTCVPVQTRMVKYTMLSKKEKAWVKEHNWRCYDKLAVHLKDDNHALKWLKGEAKRWTFGLPGLDTGRNRLLAQPPPPPPL